MSAVRVAIYRHASPANELVTVCDGWNDTTPNAWKLAIREAISAYAIGTRFPLNSWHYGEIVTLP